MKTLNGFKTTLNFPLFTPEGDNKSEKKMKENKTLPQSKIE